MLRSETRGGLTRVERICQDCAQKAQHLKIVDIRAYSEADTHTGKDAFVDTVFADKNSSTVKITYREL